jgi:hypothetical protein
MAPVHNVLNAQCFFSMGSGCVVEQTPPAITVIRECRQLKCFHGAGYLDFPRQNMKNFKAYYLAIPLDAKSEIPCALSSSVTAFAILKNLHEVLDLVNKSPLPF